MNTDLFSCESAAKVNISMLNYNETYPFCSRLIRGRCFSVTSPLFVAKSVPIGGMTSLFLSLSPFIIRGSNKFTIIKSYKSLV